MSLILENFSSCNLLEVAVRGSRCPVIIFIGCSVPETRSVAGQLFGALSPSIMPRTMLRYAIERLAPEKKGYYMQHPK